MSEQMTTDVITKTVNVARPPDDAFRTFVERIGDWWPREYALGGERTERIVLEPREGGRVFEVEADGREHAWGTVVASDPPARLVLSWGLNGSEVELRFSSDRDGTRVDLEHRGWEHLEDGRERAQYDAGWDAILRRYVDVVETAKRAVRKTVHVACRPEKAFRLYTDGIATWWPLDTHSVEEENAETVIFEPRLGGRILERSRGGVEHHWGTVLEWEPFTRFVHTWHPGRDESTGQVVEMRFLPDGDGTLVELVHTGWDALGSDADATHANYEGGWDYVIGERFAAAAR